MRTPYLGDTLVWTFRDDAERATYRASRRWPGYRIGLLVVLPAMVGGLLGLSFGGGSYATMSGVVLGGTIRELWLWQLDRRASLLSLDLRLLSGRFMITEHYGKGLRLYERQLGVFNAKRIMYAQWASDGLLLTMRRWRSPVRHVLLHRGLFSDQGAINALYRWAEEHKITIDGVPPLPGAYVRPIEERRGL